MSCDKKSGNCCTKQEFNAKKVFECSGVRIAVEVWKYHDGEHVMLVKLIMCNVMYFLKMTNYVPSQWTNKGTGMEPAPL